MRPPRPPRPAAPATLTTHAAPTRMASWMDLEKIPVAIGDMNDVKGLKASAALIHSQLDAAVAKGTASTDIVIGGFSQGGAMALYAGYTYPKTLAGVVVFSGWAPLQAADEATFMGDVKAGANANTPAFIAHGKRSTPNLSASAASAASAAAEPATRGSRLARGALTLAHGGPLGPRAELRPLGPRKRSPGASQKARPKTLVSLPVQAPRTRWCCLAAASGWRRA